MGCCACLGFARNALRADRGASMRSGPGSRAHLFGRGKGATSPIPGALGDAYGHANPSSSTRYIELNVVAKREAAEDVGGSNSADGGNAHAGVGSDYGIGGDGAEAGAGADPDLVAAPHNPVALERAPGSSRGKGSDGVVHFN